MNTAGVQDALEELGDDLSDVQKSLQPLLTSALSETTKKLPLLDRAKLYTTIVYAIESLLFSYLRLQGVDAKEHKVMTELKRVQQYFKKITEAEAKPQPDNKPMTLNKQAASRILKHHLAPNQTKDLELEKKKEILIMKRQLAMMEERKRQREQQGASPSAPATPAAAPGSNAQSPEADASLVASAIAQIKEDAAADMATPAADANPDAQNPDSPTPSQASSSKSARKSKKRRHQDRSVDDSPSSGKKKRKYVGTVGMDPDGPAVDT